MRVDVVHRLSETSSNKNTTYQGKSMEIRRVGKGQEDTDENETENIGQYQERVPINTELSLRLIFHTLLYPKPAEARRQKTALT